ncbi:MAG: hypothetical protein QM629_20570 [Parafilimonas sp.]
MHEAMQGDADFTMYQSMKKVWEPVKNHHHLVLHSTNDNINDMLEETATYLFLKNDKTKH